MRTCAQSCTHQHAHIFFHLTQLKHNDMSGNACTLGMWRNQEKWRENSAGKSRVGVREERFNCNAIEKQFVKLVHMHAGLQSPSAHIISSLLVTSTKTKRFRMLQMYYAGGIIKSNPSQSQLYLPKDTKLHAFVACVCMRARVRVCMRYFLIDV